MAETIVQRILETKRKEVDALRESTSQKAMQDAAAHADPPRDFFGALTGPCRRTIHLIAEIKKASPSAGVIRGDFDPVAIARAYATAGVDALSVLTDEPYFQGSLEYLTAARSSCSLPVLRKDFIIDPLQVYQARAAGADAILLIVSALDDETLVELMCLSGRLGMAVLLEFHDEMEIQRWQSVIRPRVMEVGPAGMRWLIGVNNRDLRTFTVDLGTTLRLRDRLSRDAAVVSESGIRTREDITILADAGVTAVLVGETFMRNKDIAKAVEELMGPSSQ